MVVIVKSWMFLKHLYQTQTKDKIRDVKSESILKINSLADTYDKIRLNW